VLLSASSTIEIEGEDMKLGKVVGTVVLSQCIEPLRGRPLHLVMDLDENLQTVGEAEICTTWEVRGEGETVIFEVAREAANVFGEPFPTDASIIGKVDKVHIEE
jgi:microcompartment protein CcmK/EutM